MKKENLDGDRPATQHDLSLLGGHLTTRLDQVDARLGRIEATMATKEDLQQVRTELQEDMRQHKEEIIRQFQAAIEIIRDQLVGPTVTRSPLCATSNSNMRSASPLLRSGRDNVSRMYVLRR